MLLLDANVLLRALVDSDLPHLQDAHRLARRVFLDIDSGKTEAMVSDAVIAEVAFVLTSPGQYGLSAIDAVDRLKVIVGLRGLQVSHRQILMNALDLWAAHPKLGFVDSLVAAQAQHLDVQLFSFDSDFDGIDGIERWVPPEQAGPDE